MTGKINPKVGEDNEWKERNLTTVNSKEKGIAFSSKQTNEYKFQKSPTINKKSHRRKREFPEKRDTNESFHRSS